MEFVWNIYMTKKIYDFRVIFGIQRNEHEHRYAHAPNDNNNNDDANSSGSTSHHAELFLRSA